MLHGTFTEINATKGRAIYSSSVHGKSIVKGCIVTFFVDTIKMFIVNGGREVWKMQNMSLLQCKIYKYVKGVECCIYIYKSNPNERINN